MNLSIFKGKTYIELHFLLHSDGILIKCYYLLISSNLFLNCINIYGCYVCMFSSLSYLNIGGIFTLAVITYQVSRSLMPVILFVHYFLVSEFMPLAIGRVSHYLASQCSISGFMLLASGRGSHYLACDAG